MAAHVDLEGKMQQQKKSLDDESVKQNEQRLTADGSIHLVAVNKTLAAQSIPVQLWPILDIFRCRQV